MILAESATVHPDGTISMLRGGLGRLFGASPPFNFRGCLAIRIDADEAGDQGQHRFAVRSTRSDGQALPEIDGEFTVSAIPGVISFAVGVQVARLGLGELSFEFLVDDRPMSSWTLKVDQDPPG